MYNALYSMVGWSVIIITSPVLMTCRQIQGLADDLSKPAEGAEDLFFPTQYSQSSIRQLSSCLWKQNLTYWRSPEYNNVRYYFTFLSALFFGTVFLQIGKNR